MTFSFVISSNQSTIHRVDDEIVKPREMYLRQGSFYAKRIRLKAGGITLLIVGLLLIVTGIALTVALFNYLLLSIVVVGFILTVLSGILLMKAKQCREQPGVETSIISIERSPITSEQPEEVGTIVTMSEPEPQSNSGQPETGVFIVSSGIPQTNGEQLGTKISEESVSCISPEQLVSVNRHVHFTR